MSARTPLPGDRTLTPVPAPGPSGAGGQGCRVLSAIRCRVRNLAGVAYWPEAVISAGPALMSEVLREKNMPPPLWGSGEPEETEGGAAEEEEEEEDKRTGMGTATATATAFADSAPLDCCCCCCCSFSWCCCWCCCDFSLSEVSTLGVLVQLGLFALLSRLSMHCLAALATACMMGCSRASMLVTLVCDVSPSCGCRSDGDRGERALLVPLFPRHAPLPAHTQVHPPGLPL